MLYWEQLLQVEGAEITEALKLRPVKRAASKDPTVTELRRAGSNGSKMNIAILGDGTDDMALFNGLNWNGAYLGMFESRDGVLQLRRTYANTSGFSRCQAGNSSARIVSGFPTSMEKRLRPDRLQPRELGLPTPRNPPLQRSILALGS